jgi:hypothetical protein
VDKDAKRRIRPHLVDACFPDDYQDPSRPGILAHVIGMRCGALLGSAHAVPYTQPTRRFLMKLLTALISAVFVAATLPAMAADAPAAPAKAEAAAPAKAEAAAPAKAEAATPAKKEKKAKKKKAKKADAPK